MPVLTPLLLAAAGAFGGIAGLTRLRRGRIVSCDDARRGWLEHFPGDRVTDCVISRDGRSALVATSWGAGLVCRGGHVARRLDAATVEQTSGGLDIRFNTLETPRVHVSLEGSDAALWAERIEGD